MHIKKLSYLYNAVSSIFRQHFISPSYAMSAYPMRDDPMKQSIWSKVPCFTKTGTFTGSIVQIEETDTMGIAKLFFKPDKTTPPEPPADLSVSRPLYNYLYRDELDAAGAFQISGGIRLAVGRASVSALSGNFERGVFDLSYRPDHRWGRKACLHCEAFRRWKVAPISYHLALL